MQIQNYWIWLYFGLGIKQSISIVLLNLIAFI